MDAAKPSERDELVFYLVKGDKALHLGLAILYAVVLVGAVGLGIAVIVADKGLDKLVMMVGFGLGAAGSAAYEWKQYKDYVAALAEIGDRLAGIDTCKTYSLATARVISGSRKTVKELRQLWIAYGLIAVMLLGFAVFFAVLCFSGDFEDDLVIFYISGGAMAAMGLPLLLLAVRAFREWIVARKLEKW